MLLWEALKEDLDWNGTHAWLKVKQSKSVDSKPISNILGIGKSSGKADKSNSVASLL